MKYLNIYGAVVAQAVGAEGSGSMEGCQNTFRALQVTKPTKCSHGGPALTGDSSRGGRCLCSYVHPTVTPEEIKQLRRQDFYYTKIRISNVLITAWYGKS